MQPPAHLLVGILVYQVVYVVFSTLNPISLGILIFTLTFYSHFIVDAVGIITYHPSKIMLKDRFWVTYSVIIICLSVIILENYWIPCWYAMIGSLAIDIIDWLFLKAILKKKPIIHPLIDKFRAVFFSRFPDETENKKAVFFEVLFTLFILAAFGFVS